MPQSRRPNTFISDLWPLLAGLEAQEIASSDAIDQARKNIYNRLFSSKYQNGYRNRVTLSLKSELFQERIIVTHGGVPWFIYVDLVYPNGASGASMTYEAGVRSMSSRIFRSSRDYHTIQLREDRALVTSVTKEHLVAREPSANDLRFLDELLEKGVVVKEEHVFDRYISRSNTRVRELMSLYASQTNESFVDFSECFPLFLPANRE